MAFLCLLRFYFFSISIPLGVGGMKDKLMNVVTTYLHLVASQMPQDEG